MSAGNCSVCGRPFPPSKRPSRRKGTRCRPCIGASIATMPGVAERKSASMKQRFADPSHLEKHAARIKAGIHASMQNPERLEQMRQRGKELGKLKNGFNSYPPGHPDRIAAARKSAETKLAWCPPDYRADYRKLLGMGFSAAEARPMIINQIKADASRAAREMTGVSAFAKARGAMRYLAQAGEAAA